jgi:hypothetical protein
MKSISILSILVLSSFSLLLSQPNDRVTAGQLAYEDAKYDQAISLFNEALLDFTNLDKDKISLQNF